MECLLCVKKLTKVQLYLPHVIEKVKSVTKNMKPSCR